METCCVFGLTHECRSWKKGFDNGSIVIRHCNGFTSDYQNPKATSHCLKTIRMLEMIDWYGTVIGASPNVEGPMMPFLSNDDANDRIALLSPLS
jgi:hypothetical protein